MTYTNVQIAANIGGRRYVRKMFFQLVDLNDDGFMKKLPFISVNGEKYLVFRRDGVPCSVYKWKEYLNYLDNEAFFYRRFKQVTGMTAGEYRRNPPRAV